MIGKDARCEERCEVGQTRNIERTGKKGTKIENKFSKKKTYPAILLTSWHVCACALLV
jgi:hypothetical protein